MSPLPVLALPLSGVLPTSQIVLQHSTRMQGNTSTDTPVKFLEQYKHSYNIPESLNDSGVEWTELQNFVTELGPLNFLKYAPIIYDCRSLNAVYLI